MSADTLLQYLTEALFVLIFLVVAGRALHQPRRANLDTALLFGALLLIEIDSWATIALHLKLGYDVAAVGATLIMALPYLLLRLVDDFTVVPRPWMIGGILGLALSTLSFFLVAQRLVIPTIVLFLLSVYIVLYFGTLTLYIAIAFVLAARRANGITRRRMQAVGVGTLSLGLIVVTSGAHAAVPALAAWWTVLSDCFTLGAGICYFMGFAPPVWLRRAWQEPEVRAFLLRAARLPHVPTTPALVEELERGAAAVLGAPQAAIGLWDDAAQVLRFTTTQECIDPRASQTLTGRAFVTQRPLLSDDVARDNPPLAGRYRATGVGALVAAPMTAGARTLGVLAVAAGRPSIFADDDLVLACLLADQAALMVESQALMHEAARVRAREEATRLKDDFLSAAAHDLKTPLTALVARAQLLEHRALRDPLAPPDMESMQRLCRDAQRLKRLVLDLLDVARMEHGALVGSRETVDLVPIIREACARQTSARHRVLIESRAPVVGSYDVTRLMQLVDNLLENAIKYSPDGGDVHVHIGREGREANLTVQDQGIGIPAVDLPRLFDRFHRGSNVDDRRFAGMGLGLSICRQIAEEHGGRLWASSDGPGQGSTFHVTLPAGDSELRSAVRVGQHVG